MMILRPATLPEALKIIRHLTIQAEKLKRAIIRADFTKTKIEKKLMRAKEPTLGQLKKRAWREISRYVRYTGEPVCFTCDRKSEPKELHTGHFYHGKLDWDLRNLRKQCPQCNVWKHGNLSEYRKRLTVELGQAEMEKLDFDAHQEFKPTREFFLEVAAKYKALNDAMDGV